MAESKTQKWLQQLIDAPSMRDLADALAAGEHLAARGAWGSSSHLVAGAVRQHTARPVLLVLAHLDDADEAVEDLSLVPGVAARAFPALEVMPGETNVSLELLADRLDIVRSLADGDQPDVLVAPIQALMQAVPQAQAMSRIVRQLAPGDELDIAEFTTWLTSTGYNRTEGIEQPGDFTVRGGVIDVFPPGEAPAVRIDLFGDTIDTLAEIDLDSLGSNRKLDRVRLVGATVDKLQDDDATVPLWSLLDSQTMVVLHEPLEIAEQARGYFERLTNPIGIYSPQAVLKALQKQPGVAIAQFGGGAGGGQREIDLPVDRLHNFAEHANEAVAELGAFALGLAEHPPHDVTVLCQKQAELDRLRELILEHAPDAADRITLELGYLHRGFIWGSDDRPTMIVPHHELFHRYASRRRLRRVSVGSLGKGSETFFDLEPGDYVVHADHGVAVFRGLRTMRKGDAAEEYLTLEFADKALLHVPASQIEFVQKYIGGFSGRPPLSKLGGKRWKKQKEQVAEAVKDLAAELLRVQAARAAMPRHRVSRRFALDDPVRRRVPLRRNGRPTRGHGRDQA